MGNTVDRYFSVGDESDLDDYEVVPYYVAESQRRVSVAKIDGKVYAFDDLCPMHKCPLSAGLLRGTDIMCQCGGCTFDVRNGAVLTGPVEHPIRVYPVRVDSGKVQLQV